MGKNRADLQPLLDNHRSWNDFVRGGQQLVLMGEDLGGIDLSGVDLSLRLNLGPATRASAAAVCDADTSRSA